VPKQGGGRSGERGIKMTDRLIGVTLMALSMVALWLSTHDWP
jgi:hypothetical protein